VLAAVAGGVWTSSPCGWQPHRQHVAVCGQHAKIHSAPAAASTTTRRGGGSSGARTPCRNPWPECSKPNAVQENSKYLQQWQVVGWWRGRLAWLATSLTASGSAWPTCKRRAPAASSEHYHEERRRVQCAHPGQRKINVPQVMQQQVLAAVDSGGGRSPCGWQPHRQPPTTSGSVWPCNMQRYTVHQPRQALPRGEEEAGCSTRKPWPARAK
jgi:hypothetical protein